jgi:hypothetical protein
MLSKDITFKEATPKSYGAQPYFRAIIEFAGAEGGTLQLQSSAVSLNCWRSDMAALDFIKHQPVCHLSRCKDLLDRQPDGGEGGSI